MSARFSTRREFLELFGRTTAAAGLASLLPTAIPQAALSAGPELKRLARRTGQTKTSAPSLPFQPLQASGADSVSLPSGFSWKPLITWGDSLNERGETFGINNDFIAVIPRDSAGTDLIMWVNHESTIPLLVSGWTKETPRTREQVEKEQRSVGGSLLRVQKQNDGSWAMVKNDPLNRRLDATTPIPLVSARDIRGTKSAIGTLANCAGGVTPWKTILTCEENYDGFYGEAVYDAGAKNRRIEPGKLGWEKFFDRPPEHYGWVVEVDPLTGRAKKLTALGRFSHECATTVTAKDGRCVVYTGDDGEDRCLYKFIAEKPGSLDSGVLHVLSLEKKRWIPLDIRQHEVLRKNFVDQTDVLIRCRDAAPMVGGTPLDRPEDVEVDPKTGAVYVCLTNNAPAGRPFGSIMKIEEKDGDPLSLEFASSVFLAGGADSGVACPDNMAFDRKGNLWLTNDVGGSQIGKGQFGAFGNNSLFYVPLSGPEAGRAFRVASAPMEAEFTGPCFSPDGRTLFLSVQHPGERSQSLSALTSHWPGSADSVPKSAVITISGPALDSLVL